MLVQFLCWWSLVIGVNSYEIVTTTSPYLLLLKEEAVPKNHERRVQYSPMSVVGDSTAITWRGDCTALLTDIVSYWEQPRWTRIEGREEQHRCPLANFSESLVYRVDRDRMYTDIYGFVVSDGPNLYHLLRWPQGKDHTRGMV